MRWNAVDCGARDRGLQLNQKDGKVAAVAADIPAAQAFKTVDVKGLYVTPGLIDIHAQTWDGITDGGGGRGAGRGRGEGTGRGGAR